MVDGVSRSRRAYWCTFKESVDGRKLVGFIDVEDDGAVLWPRGVGCALG